MGGGISQLTGRPDEKSEPKQVVVGSAPPNLNEITTEEKPADRDMADIPVPSPGAGGGGGWKTASPKPKEKSTRKIDPQDSDDEDDAVDEDEKKYETIPEAIKGNRRKSQMLVQKDGADRTVERKQRMSLRISNADQARAIRNSIMNATVNPVPQGPHPECVIRLITVNDVYELDNLPRMLTAKRQESQGCDVLLSILAGDFVAPSLLSSLDKGFAMVDVMNRVGIDYVCIGNHESDIPMPQLWNRIKQSRFTWVNSNMQSMPMGPGMEKLPEYVNVMAKSGDHERKMCFLGLNVGDPGIYSPGAFGGCEIEPVNECAKKMHKKVTELEKPDIIVPMTHQNMPFDRELAEMEVGFPVIIGGHDHELYSETVKGAKIIKMGMDAQKFGIIDIVWMDKDQTEPEIHIRIKDATEYEPDPEVDMVVKKHQKVLAELDRAVLCPFPQGVVLSSKKVRLHQTTMGTFLLSTMRKILNCDAALLCGGNIRADREYTGEKVFTYAMLKGEAPFENNMIVVVKLPGYVLASAVKYSRQYALGANPTPKGMFLQVDDGITVDPENNVLTIAGKPIDLEKKYSVALNHQVVNGMDGIRPIVDYAKAHPDDPEVHVSDEVSTEIKHIYTGYFSKVALYNILTSCSFTDLDKDGDGMISREELLEAAQEQLSKHGFDDQEGVSSLWINNVFNVAMSPQVSPVNSPLNSPRTPRSRTPMSPATISTPPKECIRSEDILALALTVHDDITYDGHKVDRELDFKEVNAVAKKILGKAYDSRMVHDIFDELDTDSKGVLLHSDLVGRLFNQVEANAVVI